MIIGLVPSTMQVISECQHGFPWYGLGSVSWSWYCLVFQLRVAYDIKEPGIGNATEAAMGL